ncbi:MAG: sensor histidine kinase [Hyphomicrobiaceae bacterium]
MTPALARVRRKWRPSVRLILLVLNLAVLALPLAGFAFLRIYENQLVRETEGELIGQAATIGTVLKHVLLSPPENAPAVAVRTSVANRRPPVPQIDLARDALLPRRPEGVSTEMPPDDPFVRTAQGVARLFAEARTAALSGLRILDANGIVVGGRAEIGLSLAHLPEVQRAMMGRYAGVLRERVAVQRRPALASMSRSAGVRVFVAYPVMDAKRLLGIVYMSRTPDSIWHRAWEVRVRLLLVGLGILGVTVGLVMIASRTILGPVDALIRQAELLAAGRMQSVTPLAHAGTREIARLADSVADMALALNRRSGHIRQFAVHVSHEFKTPLTAIQGASELLAEHFDTMGQADRRRFLQNIADDADRLRRLVERLNDLAKAESTADTEIPVDAVVALKRYVLGNATAGIEIAVSGPRGAAVRVPEDGLAIIAANLISNALQAGATRLDMDVVCEGPDVKIVFADNGPGVSPGNRRRIFEPFFTTKRENGGTGLGLRIVAALVEAHGGRITLGNAAAGAIFIVTLPRAEPPIRARS